MTQISSTPLREKIIAVFLSVLGVSSLVWAWIICPPRQLSMGELLLTMLFASAIILADNYPIHILRGTKISLINLPIFLSAVLLPTPLAVTAVGVGLLCAYLRAFAERGLLVSDVAAFLGQWIFITFLGSQVMRTALPGAPNRDELLLLCALVFFITDLVVFTFTQSYILGEPFISNLRSNLKEGFFLEITQYLIAILGSLAAFENMWALALLIGPIAITYMAFKNLKETRFETVQILEDMADTVDLRDVYTGGHSNAVAGLVNQLLDHMKISGPEATIIKLAARLHDIGKIGIPDSILKKPEKLSHEEMVIMQTHPQKGAELLLKYKDFSRGAQIVRHHHERWDGTGYPSGIKNFEIPYGARVIAVVDSFHAMISDRPYRKALTVQRAIQILREGRGTQWDPEVVNAFIELISKQLPSKSQEKLQVDDQVNLPMIPQEA